MKQFVLILAAILLVLSAGPALAELAPWTAHSTHKVRPFDEPQNEGDAVRLYCAQNEWEAVQVIVRDDAQAALTGCDVTVSALQGPGDDITEIDLYRETYVMINVVSQKPGDPAVKGWWPDGLVPFNDYYFDEDRDGAPFDVQEGWNQPIWIDIYVPTGQTPGDYSGAIEVTCQDKATASISLTLTVWDFALPDAITLPSNYGYTCSGVYNKHQGMGGSLGRNELTQLYYTEALRHRMMLSSGHCAGPEWTWDPVSETGVFDLTAFEETAGPVFDGTLYKDGVSFDTYRMPYAPGGYTERIAFWRTLAQEFKARGWFEKMYLYLPDEPNPSQYPRLVELAAELHEADPDYKAMATEQIAEALIGSVDIWCPDEPLFSDAFPRPPFPEDYPPRQELGETVWWYNCMSAQFLFDFSNHFVDNQGMYMRIWTWLTRRYNFDGLLFWETVYLYGQNDDPWTDQYATKFFCNGDGNMFYPGVPDKIGGVNDIPVPSLRLKIFREAMEDYEYFALLDKMGYEDFVQAEVEKQAYRTYQWEHDPLVVEKARQKLAGMILGTLDTDAPAMPTGLAAVAGEDFITLTWSAVADQDLDGYQISLSRYPGERIVVQTVSAATVEVTLPDLQIGKPYYLSVRAFDQTDNLGAWSEEVSAIPGASGDDDTGDDDDSGDADADDDDDDDDGCCG